MNIYYLPPRNICIYTAHGQKPRKTLAQNLNKLKIYSYYILATSKLWWLMMKIKNDNMNFQWNIFSKRKFL